MVFKGCCGIEQKALNKCLILYESMEEIMTRLEDWLKDVELPEMAKTCIENFVCSCEQLEKKDMLNFVYLDIIHFSSQVQDTLIQGFFYSYFGVNIEKDMIKHFVDYFVVSGYHNN